MQVLCKIRGLITPCHSIWATGSRHEEHGSREVLQRAYHADGPAILPGIVLHLQKFYTQPREDCSPAQRIPADGMYIGTTSVEGRTISSLRTAQKGVACTADTALTTHRLAVLGIYGRL